GIPLTHRDRAKGTLFTSILRKKAIVFPVLGALLLAIAFGAFFYLNRESGAVIDTLAVLPFTNVNSDPNTEYLSDGITESLINSLSQLPTIKVRSRNSVFHYK